MSRYKAFFLPFIILALAACQTRQVETVPTITPRPSTTPITSTYVPTTPALPSETKTPEPTVTVVLPIATLTTPPMPTQSGSSVMEKLKVAYVTFVYMGDQAETKLWVLAGNSPTPQVVVNPQPQNAINDKNIAWSHDGTSIAYTHLDKNNAISISTVDINSLQVRQLGLSLPLHPYGEATYYQLAVYRGSWSLDDQWIAVSARYTKAAKGTELHRTILVNTIDDSIIDLPEDVEFVAWSPIHANRYLYITHPHYTEAGENTVAVGKETLNVGEVSQPAPLLTFSDLGGYSLRYSALAWSNDEQWVLLNTYDLVVSNRQVMLLLNMEQQTLERRPFLDPFYLASWSPDDKWVAVWQSALYLWDVPNNSLIKISPQAETDITPKTWIEGGKFFTYQDGSRLYAVKPGMPASPPLLLADLSTVPLDNAQLSLDLSVWGH